MWGKEKSTQDKDKIQTELKKQAEKGAQLTLHRRAIGWWAPIRLYGLLSRQPGPVQSYKENGQQYCTVLDVFPSTAFHFSIFSIRISSSPHVI
jgi:hypothetical protein